MSSVNLINFQSIVERMKQASGLQNESAIAKALDISPQAMSNFKNKGEIPADRIIQFAGKFKLSVDWLLTGEGQMRREECKYDVIKEATGEYHTDFGKTDLRDPETQEIVDILSNDLPEMKKYLLKFLRGTKERKEGAQGMGLPDPKLNEEG